MLQPGQSYQQDDFVIFKFDCSFKVTYYREYYDSNQIVSTYVFVAPTTRQQCCGGCHGWIADKPGKGWMRL